MLKNLYHDLISNKISSNNLFLIISFTLLLQTNRSLIADETIEHVLMLYAYVSIIILTQLSVLALLKKFLLSSLIRIFFLTINFLSLLIFIPVSILIKPVIIKLIIIPFLIFILLYVVFYYSEKIKILNLNLKLICISLLIFNFISLFYNLSINYFPKKISNEDIYKNLNIKFKKKKNIHVFYFDSLTKNELLKEKLNIENIKYNQFLNKNFFVFKNTLADAIPTNPSLNSLFFLDPDLKLWLDQKNRFNFANGIQDSPLASIFRNNNYKIAVGADFGSKVRGEYINFDSGKKYSDLRFLQSPLFCNFRGKSKFLIFFSACIFYDSNSLNLNVIENLQRYSQSGSNWLTINFLLYPAHAPFGYIHENSVHRENYKKNYLKGSNTAYLLMKEIKKKIQKYDPNSILIILGDHGLITSISKTINSSANIDEIKKIFIDRHSIQIGIYEKDNYCKKYYENYRYMTPTILMKRIIQCFENRNQDTLDKGFVFDTLGLMTNPYYNPKKLPFTKKEIFK